MTVRAVEQQVTQVERSDGMSVMNKVKEVVAAVVQVAAPCFRWTGLDYLDPAYRARMSAAQKAKTDADLHRAQANF